MRPFLRSFEEHCGYYVTRRIAKMARSGGSADRSASKAQTPCHTAPETDQGFPFCDLRSPNRDRFDYNSAPIGVWADRRIAQPWQ